MSNKEELIKLLEEQERRIKYNKFKYAFPATGPLRRELYLKQLQFINATQDHFELLLAGGNRSGKTFTINWLAALWSTGMYEDWHTARRFNKPVRIMLASINNTVTKDLFQKELLGDNSDIGTGLIPKDNIVKLVPKPGVPEAFSEIHVKDVLGNINVIYLKSYDQGRRTFQGTKYDVVMFDEEPPEDVYNEATMRLMATKPGEISGIALIAFTPLLGMTKLIQHFLPGGKYPSDNVHPDDPTKYIVNITWDDVPHIPEEEKQKKLQGMNEKERLTRTRGIPAMGAGAIYPILEEEIIVVPFRIPDYFKKAYGIFVNFKNVSVIWGCQDPYSGIIYLTHEYSKKRESTSIHADAIKKQNKRFGYEVPGAINSKSNKGSSEYDLFSEEDLYLDIVKGDIEVDTKYILQLLETNQVKIFNTLEQTLRQLRLYRRNEDGKILDEDMELMEAMRNLLTCSIHIAESFPEEETFHSTRSGKNPVTGY